MKVGASHALGGFRVKGGLRVFEISPRRIQDAGPRHVRVHSILNFKGVFVSDL